jgi:hypothetical protein
VPFGPATRGDDKDPKRLTDDALAEIRAMEGVEAVSPRMQFPCAITWRGHKTPQTFGTGVDPAFLQRQTGVIEYGEAFGAGTTMEDPDFEPYGVVIPLTLAASLIADELEKYAPPLPSASPAPGESVEPSASASPSATPSASPTPETTPEDAPVDEGPDPFEKFHGTRAWQETGAARIEPDMFRALIGQRIEIRTLSSNSGQIKTDFWICGIGSSDSLSFASVLRGTVGVMVPVKTALALAPIAPGNAFSDEAPAYQLALVRVKLPEQVKTVEKALTDNGYEAQSFTRIFEGIEVVFTTITIILSLIGLIALAVACVGIVNTLLMATYERFREIGVLIAVGATPRVVRRNFIMEGGLIGLLGGLVGVGGAYVAGIIIEQIAGSFEPELLASGGIFRMPWDYVVLWIGISVGVSVIAALYPAARASRVDPVEALRGA